MKAIKGGSLLTAVQAKKQDALSPLWMYVDSEWRIYFRVREFLLSRGLPDKARVRSAITQGVLEIADRRRIWLVYE